MAHLAPDVLADPVALTRALCDIESVSGDEQEIADAVEAALRGAPHLSVERLGQSVIARTHLGRGTRVGIAMPDGPDFAIVMMAVCSAATCAPLNAALDEEALVRLLVAMRIDALIVPEGPDSTSSHS